MAYHCSNREQFAVFSNANWWTITQVNELLRALNKVNFSVVSSRQEGLTALENFQNVAITGRELFRSNARFPDALDEIYVTDAWGQVNNILGDLQGSLSWRMTNKAKDTEANTSDGRVLKTARLDAGENMDQGAQDQTKAFLEQRKVLKKVTTAKDEVFMRPSFESRCSCVWIPAPGGGDGDGGGSFPGLGGSGKGRA